MSKYVAEPYVAGSPEALVLGQIVESFASNLESEHIEPLLPKYGFDNIDPEAWYPHQNWMDLLRELQEKHGKGVTSIFVAFGRSAVETAAMPPEISTIPGVLALLHDIHHLNLRNIPEDEGYVIERVGERHYHVYHNTPNPDDVIYGFIWGLCARFKAPGEIFSVMKIANPKPDKQPGSVFEVKWGPEGTL